MLSRHALLLLSALGLGLRAHAAPSALGDGNANAKRQAAPYTIASSQISTYTPYTWYASAGYCQPAATLSWSCGANCQANSGFKPVASGGDGDETQYWFVGYDPSLKTVIVSHQGTNPSEIEPIVTDGKFELEPMDSGLFPTLQSGGMEVHDGFQETFVRSAPSVLAAVKTTMSTYGAKSVTTVGHSLGAAIALLDAVYLPLNLPSSTTFTSVVYGLPRVGNQAFADYVDNTGTSKVHLTHINNELDPIPTCPGEFLDFVHPSGELHIQATGTWYSCPGQDNPSTDCIVGAVPEIYDGSLSNHDGPYGPVTMGC